VLIFLLIRNCSQYPLTSTGEQDMVAGSCYFLKSRVIFHKRKRHKRQTSRQMILMTPMVDDVMEMTDEEKNPLHSQLPNTVAHGEFHIPMILL
jgi:hypothetical protein